MRLKKELDYRYKKMSFRTYQVFVAAIETQNRATKTFFTARSSLIERLIGAFQLILLENNESGFKEALNISLKTLKYPPNIFCRKRKTKS